MKKTISTINVNQPCSLATATPEISATSLQLIRSSQATALLLTRKNIGPPLETP